MMLRFYWVTRTFWGGKPCIEACLHAEAVEDLTWQEKRQLRRLLCDFTKSDELSAIPFLRRPGIEIGQRIDVPSPLSGRLVALCHTIGLVKVRRIEQSLRYKDKRRDLLATLDHETEMVYTRPPESFVLPA